MKTVNLSGDFTISLWFNATSFTSQANELITNPNNGSGGVGIAIGAGTGIDLNSPNQFGNRLCSYSFQTGTWYHIVVSRNNGDFLAWVNGIPQSVSYGDSNDYSGPIALGYDNSGSGNQFVGKIDEVGIWTKPLRQTDVSALYNFGLANQYPFNNPPLPPYVTNGLVFYTDALGYSGNGSSWIDEASGLVGTNNGGATYNSQAPSYFNFNGNQSIDFQDPNQVLNLTNNFTLETWCNITGDNQWGALLSYAGQGGPGGGWEQYAIGTWGDGTYYFSSGATGNNITGPSITDNNWQHLVVTFQDGNVVFYINGVNVYSTYFGYSTLNQGTNPYLSIGDNQAGGQEYLYGNVGLSRIYNRVLSTNEITQNYNVTKDRFTGLKLGLIGYWGLNSSSWEDLTNNGYNLTSVGNVSVGTGILGGDAYLNPQGTQSYLQTSNFNNLANIGSGDISANYWINPTDYGTGGFESHTGYSLDLRQCINGGNTDGWSVGFNNGNYLSIFTSSGGDVYTTNATIPTGSWTMVTLSRNNNTTSVYINGVLDGTFSDYADFTSTQITLGCVTDYVYFNINGLQYDGNIDEVGIWNRALSQDEITKLYNTGQGLAYPFNQQPYNLKDNIVAYWSLDDTTWSDSSGNGYTLTNNGGVTNGTGILSGDAVFGGSNWLENDPGLTIGTSDFTFSAWINPSSINATAIVNQGNNDSTGNYCFWYNNGNIGFYADNNGRIESTNTIPLGSWSHVALVSKEGVLTLYINGNADPSTGNYSGNFIGQPFKLGFGYGGIQYLTGSLDEVGIWNRALSRDEISYLYNDGRALAYPFLPTSGLALWLDASDSATVLNSGTPATDGQSISQWSDKSGSNNHAIQSNPSNQPVLTTNILNGNPVVRFDGSSQYLTDTVLGVDGSHTVYIVAINRGNGSGDGYYPPLSYGGINVDEGWPFAFKSNNTFASFPEYYKLGASGGLDNIFTYTNNTPYLLGLPFDTVSQTWPVLVNGVSIATSTSNVFTSDGNNNILIGYQRDNSNVDRFFNGDIAEVLIYNRVLNDTERYAVETYLNNKYNIYTVPAIVQDGLVLWLDANDSRSYPGTGNTWYDLSPSNNNGTLNNGVSFNSGLMQFDGSSGYVNFGSYTPENESFTLEMVFDWSEYNTANVNFLFSGNYQQFEIHTGGNTGTNGLRFIPAAISSGLSASGDGYTLDETNIISGGPNHVTYVWDADSSTAYLYKNGAIDTSAVLNHTTVKTLQALNIGRRSNDQYYFQGDVYITRLYNRALNSTEVAQNFNVSRSRFGL